MEYDAPAGSIIAAVHSESLSGNQVFRVPMWDVLAQRSPTGGYPWRLEETSTTKAYIKNVTGREQDYVAFLLYENGSRYMIGLKTVLPHQTIEIDVRALRDNQVPDETGVTIPLDVSSGQLQWTLRRRDEPARNADELDTLALVGRSEQIDVIHGISSNYACQNCCGGTFLNGSIGPQGLQFDPGNIVEFQATEEGTTCYGYQFPTRVYPNNWSSSNPAVVIIGSNSGIATMIGAGTAQITANWSVERSYENYPCYGGGYLTLGTGSETKGSESQQRAAQEKDIVPSIAPCGTCITHWQPTNPTPAGLTVTPTVAKIQYKTPASHVDIVGTLYVLKGTSLLFKAVPDPANATFPSTRPIWGGSSGASGTGPTKSVAFNTVSTSTSDFKTVTASSGNTRTVNVLVFDVTGVLTPADNFFGRSLSRFGVHESIALTSNVTPSGITAAQVGGLQFVQITGNGFLNAPTDGTGTYIAADAPGSATLKLTILNGPSKESGPSNTVAVVAPSSGNVQKFSGILHYQDWWSCGFKADIFISPTDVSFNNLFFVESEVGATAGGWLAFLSNQPHNPGAPLRIGFGNSVTGARVASNGDEIFSGKYRSLEHGAYFGGTVNWAIPWNYSITGNAGTWNFMTTVNQTATSDSTGRCTISKDGSAVVTAGLGDPNSSW